MKPALKNILEALRKETKTILLVVLGCFAVSSWITASIQGCQINRRLAKVEARLDTFESRLENTGNTLSHVGAKGFLGTIEGNQEFKDPLGSGESFAAGAACSGAYCASKNSEVFHLPACEHAQKISPRNLIWFETRQDAVKTGRRPCRVCRP